MSIGRRLGAGFISILLLFLVNLAVHRWASGSRDQSFEALRQVLASHAVSSSLRQRLGDWQKEMALLGELYAGSPSVGPSTEELARFDAGAMGVERELRELLGLSDSAGRAVVGRLAGAARELVGSWRAAFESLGTDNVRSITELSVRAEPLSRQVFQVLLPEVERQEARRLSAARDDFYRVAVFTDRIALVTFGLSLAAGLFVALSLSNYAVAVNKSLEQRVRERTKELGESLSLLQATLESTADGIMVVDRSAKIRSYNHTFAELWRLPEAVLLSGDAERVLKAVLPQVADPRAFAASVRQLYTDPLAESRDVVELADGRVFERVSLPQRRDGECVGRVWSFRDVTHSRKAEQALRESEERYARAARGANDGLWDWDLVEKRIYFSPRWKSMLGYSDEEVRDSPIEWFRRAHPDDRDALGMQIVAHLEGLTPHFQHEHRVRHKQGGYVWVVARGVAVRNEQGEAVRIAGSLTDITQRKVAEQQLQHDAFHDALTDLPNRALFMDRLELTLSRAKARAQRGYEPLFAVLFVDIDRFKVVNDGLGHVLGDRLLVGIAERIAASLRPSDTVARLGGDEFTILVEDIRDVHDARLVAQRVEEALLQPFHLPGQEVFTTASIGIALGGPSYNHAEELLRDADTALYRAKALGRARYEVFDDAMRARAVAVLQLETSLRRALEREELRVFFQPIVRLATGEVVGFEALVRWKHAEWGLVSTQEFISVAEDSGLIVPIGQWVLREACRQVAGGVTRANGPLPNVSVNLSARQFMRPDLLADVTRVLEETGLEPSRLSLEITESVIIENTQLARETLARLRERGIRIHMDDFGTGYSSMSYLRDLPVDALKIDHSFVSQIGPRGERSEIVRTIVGLAHSLGMAVIAEGIETAGHLSQLKALGAEYGQGFFFSGAVEAADALSLAAAPPWLAGPEA
jgi:diguanylate cyclase (GGDEF)-like protein/PAS domain S-box-containing protein